MKLPLSIVLAMGVTAVLVACACGGTATTTAPAPTSDDRPGDGPSAAGLPRPALEAVPPAPNPTGADDEPESVLDGTNFGTLTDYPEEAIDASWAGSYGVEQGGAEVRFILQHVDDQWRFERLLGEPGEPVNRAEGVLGLSNGTLTAPDGSVTVRGTGRGVLVRERDPGDVLPPDTWVFYYRD